MISAIYVDNDNRQIYESLLEILAHLYSILKRKSFYKNNQQIYISCPAVADIYTTVGAL